MTNLADYPRRIVCLDTETTGIPDRDPLSRIIEVAACVAMWDGNTVTMGETFESLCNPGRLFWDRPECAKALEINGLTPDMIRQAPPARDVGLALLRWIRDVAPDAMTSYKTSFDFHPLLLGAPEWLQPALRKIPLAPCIIIAARVSIGLDPTAHVKGEGLSDVMSHFGVTREGDAHAALSDAIGAARLIPHVYPWPVQFSLALEPCAAPVPFTRRMLEGTR